MHKHYDVVVVGSGIAGLSFALKVADKGHSVAIVTKKNRADSNTNYAQGGIACVTSKEDDFSSHIQDTLVAGAGLCDASIVEDVVREGPARIRELVAWGVEFSRSESGFSLGKEGGHSARRILHVQDMTGRAIEQALLAAIASTSSIDLFEHHFAVDIITKFRRTQVEVALPSSEDAVEGLYILDTQSGLVETWAAPVIMLATGGIGQIYQYTTNPDIATGDGIAIAHRAGAPVADMEFVQFHPTALFIPDHKDRFLISEAVRGEGAILRDAAGRPFMKNYDSRAELAPRDIVARAIDSEMKQTGMQHMWLDLTIHNKAHLEERFPQIYKKCLEHGIAAEKDWLPVVPAAHYLCGGVQTDLSGATPIAGLYACGEVARTGLHGANRLASNSLLEAVVVAHRGADAVDDYLTTGPQLTNALTPWVDGNVQDSDERVVLAHNWDELKRIMWDYVGIVRTEKRLHRAHTRVDTLAKEIDEYYWNFKIEPKLLELRNMIATSKLIIDAALKRKDSCGLHFRIN